ncbi:microtubule-associated proteins 1A/1B light chain 3C-like isoform X4 [Oryctolagus cuniculus]|uniref:microtubule-associated proteins 1A/1B light chain 3C-like isoform X4 n=1 Tax=Oryctolagus cuniculus TaxID=9986 RepID=UPI003879C841
MAVEQNAASTEKPKPHTLQAEEEPSNQTRGSCWNPGKVPKQDPVPKILGALSHILRHLPQERPMLILLAVIVERYPREKLLSLLDKTKFLVPQELTMSQFLSIIRSRMVLRATEAFYLLVDNKSLVSMSMTMAEIYQDYKDKDGFVYMTYASQEMFGCSELAAPSSGSSHRNRPEIPFSLCQEKLVL